MPGYSSENYTDPTGHRTVAVFAAAGFGLDQPKTSAVNQNLINAAICALPDKPSPAPTSSTSKAEH